MSAPRVPYVGEGADGARRSAAIDLSEADTLPTGSHDPFWTPATEQRRNELIASAEQWQAQAADIEAAQELARQQAREHLACITCGHPDPHSGGGIGVCLHKDCGCDGPVTEADAGVAAQYDNPEPLRSEVPWVPARTVEASITRNVRSTEHRMPGTLEHTLYDLLNQLAIQAGGKHNLDLGCGFEVTLTVKAWKHP